MMSLTPENILLCVSGTTPSIITETFYYIAKLRQPNFIPDRVIVVTTKRGKEDIKRELFDNPRFTNMCRANGWDENCFTLENIVTVKTKQNVELDDIRTPEAFHEFADTLMNQVKELVRPNRYRPCIIHASLAGGRKTMSYYMGQVMSIFGRPTDSLSHILVKEGFEKYGLNFYYPYQEEQLYTLENNKKIEFIGNAHADDLLDLSEFPVLPVNSQTNMARLLKSNLSFNEILLAARDELNGVIHPIKFLGNTQKIKVSFGYDELFLEPKELACLLCLSWRRSNSLDFIHLSYPESEKKGPRLDKCLEHLNECYVQIRLITEFVKHPNEPFELESISKENWHINDPKGILDYLRPDFSTLRAKLENTSKVYQICKFKEKKQKYKDDSNKEFVVDKGKYEAPVGLLSNDDYKKLHHYMKCHLDSAMNIIKLLSKS